MSYPSNNLVETVKALPEERQNEVQEFIDLLGMSEEITAVAMDWITERLPDRYCADDPRFDVRALSWRVPIVLSYPTGEGGVVGELVLDAYTHQIRSHTAIDVIRERGKRLAQKLIHA